MRVPNWQMWMRVAAIASHEGVGRGTTGPHHWTPNVAAAERRSLSP